MKTIYFDCSMGAAGDMLTAALLELTENKDEIINELGNLEIPDVSFSAEKAEKCGITGTHITVKIGGKEESEYMHAHHHDEHSHSHHHEEHEHTHSHHHSSMQKIEHIVKKLPVSEKVKADVMAVYLIIAEAEAKVHGKAITDIHFHEVGTMDAVADVTAVCVLMEKLGAKKIVCSPIHVGSGHVHCAHGVLPVPAPATAEILKGIPSYGGEIRGELCTPTGAALLKHFANEFGNMPKMTVSKIGYGMGKKDFERANCVRAMLGETEDKTDSVFELKCNLDDMTAEEISFAAEKLMAEGALDVYTASIAMKKSRQGTLLCVLCTEEKKAKLIKEIFKHTTTIGIRETEVKRFILERETEEIETQFGTVRKKKSFGYGAEKEKYEYEDLAKIARENDLSISEVKANITWRGKS